MPIRDFSEDLFGPQPPVTRDKDGTYKSIYERVANAKPRGQQDIKEISKILLDSVGKAKPPKTIKDPEYFFKFLTLTANPEREQILRELRYDMFERSGLLKSQGWISTVAGHDNQDIKDKMIEIFSSHKIMPSSAIDLAASPDPIAQKFAIDLGAVLEKKLSAVDFGHSDAQKPAKRGISYIAEGTGTPRTLEHQVGADIPPQHGNARVVGVAVENLGNGVIEDHLYFDGNGKQLSREDAPGKETVDIIKNFSRAYHASGVLKNSFLQEEPKEIILDSMRQTGANTSAFVCASDNPEKPNQKIVDCVTFGKPSVRVRLNIEYDDGTKGVLYYYPYEKRLTILGEDNKEYKANPEDFPNIVISEPVHYNSLSNEIAQAKGAKGKTGTGDSDEHDSEIESEHGAEDESSTVTFDGGLKPVVGPHTGKALELGARPGNSVDFGAHK